VIARPNGSIIPDIRVPAILLLSFTMLSIFSCLFSVGLWSI
jgi:hypothetical protein